MAERLLDIASYQDVTDAGAVARTDVRGVIGKLSQGNTYLNPRAGQLLALRDAGLPVGGYHFGDPKVDAVTQARYFGNRLKSLGLLTDGSIFPAYDAENVPSDNPALRITWPNALTLNKHILIWRDVLRSEYGAGGLMVYGSESWWRSGMIDPNVWGDGDMWNWVANYNGRPGVLTLGWSHPQDAIHQWRSDAIRPGVTFPGINASGLDDNITLNGLTVGDLTIGGDDMAGFTAEDRQKLLDAADKITHQFTVTDDVRPVPLDEPDDVVGHVLSLRGLTIAMRDSGRIQGSSLAAVEGLVNRIAAGVTRLEQRAASGGMSEADRTALAADIAGRLPENVDTAQVVDAILGLEGTLSYRQRSATS